MSLFKKNSIKSLISDHIASLPKNGRGEVTRLARALRVSSTLVSQVLAGTRLFTSEQVQLLSEYLGYTGLEADYVTFLSQFERAGSKALKAVWEKKLQEIRTQSLKLAARVTADRSLTDQERALFYSSPLYSAVRLFSSVGEKGKTITEICERFELSRPRAMEMLKFLVDVGLCSVEDGHYFMKAQFTHLEQGSPHLLRHHSNWRIRAIRHSEELTEKELMYTAPVSLSHDDFNSLREEMVTFIKHFMEKVKASPAEEVACLNLDFFWIRR